MINVAAYIRVSTDSEDQENSFEIQEKYFSNLLKNHTDWTNAGIYSDFGISGTKIKERTGFRRLIHHCKEGKIQKIITKSISRFSRNTTDFISAIDTLKSCGVSVFFEKENLDTSERKSDFILTALSAIAQEESRSISSNILVGNKMKFAEGDVPDKDIYGYYFDENNQLQVDDFQAEIVNRIFNYAKNKVSYSEIARILNRENVPSPRSYFKENRMKNSKKGQLFSDKDYGWTRDKISSILRNERYTGSVVMQKKFTADFLSHKRKTNKGEMPMYEISNHHQGIVSSELFESVQKIVLENSRRYARKKAKPKPLSSLIICGNCGHFFNTRRDYWYCPSAEKNNGNNICTQDRIEEQKLLKIILCEFLGKYKINSTSDLKKFCKRIKKTGENDCLESDEIFLHKQLSVTEKSLQTNMKNLSLAKAKFEDISARNELLESENISDKTVFNLEKQVKFFEEKVQNDKEEIKEIQSEINEIVQKKKDFVTLSERVKNFSEKLEKIDFEYFKEHFSDEFLRNFVKEIVVFSKEKIRIKWFDNNISEVIL